MTMLLGDMMTMVRAKEEIRIACRSALTADRWYDMWFEATGDEDIADKARAAMLLEEIRRGAV